MHNRVSSYVLNLVDRQDIFMPIGSKIISAQVQRDKVNACAMIDTGAKLENRTISVICSGYSLPKINPDEKLVHIETVQLVGLVWHVFEIVQKQIA